MTEPRSTPGDPPPATPLDEAASARLDGEEVPGSGPEADDPEVVARAATFAEVSRIVGEPVDPVDDRQRDAAVAAALDAWDADREADRTADELARRRARHRTAKRWLGVAAAVAAVVGLGALVAQVDTADDESASDAGDATVPADTEQGAASGSDDGSGGAGTDSDDQGTAEQATEEQPTASLDPQVAQLGTFSSAADLLDAAVELEEQADEGSRATDAAAPDAVARARACAGEVDDRRALVALAVLEDREVAIVADRAGGDVRLQVVQLTDCSVAAMRTP
jgi:hypothetical protein